MRHNAYLLFVLLSIQLLNPSIGQSIDWEGFYGGPKEDEINEIVPTLEGHYLAVGHTSSRAFRKKDVMLRILSEEQEVLVKQNFGGNQADIGRAALNTFDGGYLIAGQTNTAWEEHHGKADAWIVKTNELGEPIWHRSYGATQNDVFNDIIQLSNGNFIAVGTFGRQGVVVCIDQWTGEACWQHLLEQQQTELTALCLTKDNNIVVIGTHQSNGSSVGIILQLNQEGQIHAAMSAISEKNLLTAEDILYDLSDQTLVIAGDYRSKDNRLDMGLVKMDKVGNIIWTKHFGGQDRDYINRLALQPGYGYALAGSTFSHDRGMRRSRGMVHLIDQQGNENTSDLLAFGGAHTDYFNTMTASRDGGWLLAGSSASNPGLDRDAWIVSIDNPITNIAPKHHALNFGSYEWIEEQPDGQLTALERTYLKIPIAPVQFTPKEHLRAEVVISEAVHGLIYFEEVQFSATDDLISVLSIPLVGDLDLADGNILVRVSFRNADNEVIHQLEHPLRTKAIPLPQLNLAVTIIKTSSTPAERNEPIEMEVRLSNTGNAVAERVGIRFFIPQRIKPLSEQVLILGNIAAGVDTLIHFSFKAKSYYEYDSIVVNAVAFEQTARRGDRITAGIKLLNFYELEDGPEFIKTPKNDFFQGHDKGHGPMLYYAPIPTQVNDIYWKAPDQDEEGLIHNEELDYVVIKLRVKSSEELGAEDFRLMINERKAEAEKDIDDQATSISSTVAFGAIGLSYTYISKIFLSEGENKIVLQVRSGGEWISSAPMTFNYLPPKNNLHVYSFGVPFDDLTFTTKDAEDFATAFEGQEKKVFEQVFTTTYITSESTTEEGLEEAMEGIFNDFYYHDKIKEGDAVMLFISSHGFVLSSKPEEFRIAGSDFDYMKERSTSIEFENDIIEIFDNLINMQKFIFIDACYSGTIANIPAGRKSNDDPIDPAISKAIVDLATATVGYNTIVSCGAGELSYEDEKWGNAAFTKAILEAFSNNEYPSEAGTIRADTNADGVLYSRELYDYLHQRVPTIVKQLRPKVDPLQTPYMSEAHQERNLPVYVLK